MNGERAQMEAALRAVVVPLLRQLGFRGSLPHFRRVTTDSVDLISFQYDRSGGGFVVEVARGGASGYTSSWGKSIPPEKLTAPDVHPHFRPRLSPQGIAPGSDHWFRFDLGTHSLSERVNRAAQAVASCLPQAEQWWNSAAPQERFLPLP